MKRLFLFCIAILVFDCFYCKGQVGEDVIHWQPSYHLKWQDFQGKVDSSSPNAAMSYCKIKYSLKQLDSVIRFQVNCVFNKRKSWATDISKVTMAHEQGHFDIAELFAIKVEQAFSAHKKSSWTNTVDDFSSLFNRFEKERSDMDKLYDEQTNANGIDLANQKKWNSDIRKKINYLRAKPVNH